MDRDGKTFQTLLNYLRNNRKIFPEFSEKYDETMFFKELHYWNVDSEHRNWQEAYLAQFDAAFLKDKQQFEVKPTKNNLNNDSYHPYMQFVPSNFANAK